MVGGKKLGGKPGPVGGSIKGPIRGNNLGPMKGPVEYLPVLSVSINGLFPAYAYTLGPSTNPKGSGWVYLPVVVS